MSSPLPVPVLEQQSPASRLFGYARVSTDDQDLSLQIDALQQHGIPKTAIFMDKVSGAKTERPGLTKCLESLTSGDILVVWRLDRLGRSMRHLITLVEDLRSKGIGFRSLNEGAIDTTCASGELIFNIFSALAQFERRLIQERTKAGLAASGGRHPGRTTTSVRVSNKALNLLSLPLQHAMVLCRLVFRTHQNGTYPVQYVVDREAGQGNPVHGLGQR